MNLIRLENVAIGYHHQAIMTKINFALQAGAMTCLLGANGCGKTTLMKTLLGLLPALEGHILLKEKSLTSYKPADIAKVIAYVPQAHDTPFTFTAIDMVMIYQVAVDNGFEGSESEWLASLKGEKGDSVKGDPGSDAANPFTEEEVTALKALVADAG